MAWVRAVFDAIAAPFVDHHTKIKPEWIDLNGHFSAGNYFVFLTTPLQSGLLHRVSRWPLIRDFLGKADDNRPNSYGGDVSMRLHVRGRVGWRPPPSFRTP